MKGRIGAKKLVLLSCGALSLIVLAVVPTIYFYFLASASSFVPWDNQTSLQALETKPISYKLTEYIDPGGSRRREKVLASSGYELYRIDLHEIGWVLWWHADGSPGVVFAGIQMDHPSQEQNLELLAMLPAGTSARVRTMVLTVPKISAEKARVTQFVRQVIGGPLSAYQVHQILDMLTNVDPVSDPTIVPWLKRISRGTMPLADLEPVYSGTFKDEVVHLVNVARPGSDRRFEGLRNEASRLYAMFAGNNPATASLVVEQLSDPRTAVETMRVLLRKHAVPPEAPSLLARAAAKATGTSALEIADFIQPLDERQYARTLVGLLTSPDPAVRQGAFEYRLAGRGVWRKADPQQVQDLYQKTTDPRMRLDLINGILTFVHRDIRTRYLTEQFFKANPHPQPGPAMRDLAIQAATAGDEQSLSRLMDAGFSPTSYGNQSETLLSMATESGNEAAVRVLLKAGWPPDQYDKALLKAVKHPQLIPLLVAAGADPNAMPGSWSALVMAVNDGSLDAIHALLKAGADVNGRTPPKRDLAGRPLGPGRRFGGGITPLMAAAHGDVAIMKLLVENGADVNDASGVGSTPLQFAVSSANGPAIRYLIEHGADARTASKALSQLVPYPDLLRLLLEHGADPNAVGAEVLWEAVHQGQADSVKLLLEYGADPDRPYVKGTPRLLAQTSPRMKEIFDHPPARH